MLAPSRGLEPQMRWYDVLGLVGVALILLAYLLLQLRRIDPAGPAFSAANAAGAALVLLSLYYDFNLPAAVVEGAWLLISLYGLGQAWQRSRRA
jgi:hypothetical protein